VLALLPATAVLGLAFAYREISLVMPFGMRLLQDQPVLSAYFLPEANTWIESPPEGLYSSPAR